MESTRDDSDGVAGKKVDSEGSVLLRMVFDFRAVNGLVIKPPWAALGGPAALSAIDICEESARGWELHGAAGDLPAFFYTLGIPETWRRRSCSRM